jgi:hypothetical protein
MFENLLSSFFVTISDYSIKLNTKDERYVLNSYFLAQTIAGRDRNRAHLYFYVLLVYFAKFLERF